METLPFPDEIILKILSYLCVFDLVKCARVSKRLLKICLDKKFQKELKEYRILKTLFKCCTKPKNNLYESLDIVPLSPISKTIEILYQNVKPMKDELVIKKRPDEHGQE